MGCFRSLTVLVIDLELWARAGAYIFSSSCRSCHPRLCDRHLCFISPALIAVPNNADCQIAVP